MKLTKPQQTISNDKTRFRVCVAGRRFGKSYLAINELAKFARYPNQRCLYIATTFRQAKGVIWNDLLQMLSEKNWVKKINQSDLQVTLVNNSTITLRSSENKEALRGLKFNFIALDEYADMDPNTWYTILRPTLSDTGGSAMFIGTPKSKNHFWDLYIQAGAEQEWSSHSYTTIQGGHVSIEEIESAKRDMGEREYLQEYEAQFIDYSGVIFYAFSEDNMKLAPTLQPQDPIFVGLDFNVDPMSAVIARVNGEVIHIIDEVEIYGSNTLEVVKEIKQRYGDKRQVFVYPDASGAKRSTNSPGMSDHVILSNNGFKVRSGKSNPPVAEAIASVNARLKTSIGENKIYIDPKCKKLRESLIKHSYKEGTRQIDKSGQWDHMTDCLRYLVHGLFPLKPIATYEGAHAPRRSGRML
tara:strand:+ start:87 stop:1322 length:1236 start_codon:yes stop_codon:yes gene_type:complete